MNICVCLDSNTQPKPGYHLDFLETPEQRPVRYSAEPSPDYPVASALPTTCVVTVGVGLSWSGVASAAGKTTLHCFDGNVIQTNEVLGKKITYEIMDSLNLRDIPQYL